MARRYLKPIVKKIPAVQEYVNRKDQLELAIVEQQKNITLLKKDIDKLQKRNALWADEVRQLRRDDERFKILWPVFEDEITKTDWRNPPRTTPYKKHKPPYTLNWVMPPMGPVSGGHADIFRAINFLESKGHKCRVYFYEALGSHTLSEIRKLLKNYAPIKAELYYNAKEILPCDAIFATNWFSAYPVFNYSGTPNKFYFVQDFEPFFEPVGSYSTFAENTYRFGFKGITLGSWLSEKLSNEYGMSCSPIELGTDLEDYRINSKKKRNKILFYARPVTPRRGFELGSLGLKLFQKEHPGIEIHCLGWDLKRYDLPFQFINRGILSSGELNELYNECIAGLVLSFTNMSLLPLEMMAAGCVPVVNDAYHTRAVSYSEKIAYCDPTPRSIADELSKIVSASTNEVAEQTSAYAQKFRWDHSNQKMESILLAELS